MNHFASDGDTLMMNVRSVVVKVVAGLMTAGAVSAVLALINVFILQSDMREVKETVRDIERRQVSANSAEIRDLRDRVSRLEAQDE